MLSEREIESFADNKNSPDLSKLINSVVLNESHPSNEQIQELRTHVSHLPPNERQSLKETIELWEKKANTLKLSQLLLLGGAYENGVERVISKDLSKARFYFEMAALTGDAKALHTLGHFEAVTSENNDAKVAELYYRAFKKGDNAAGNHLKDLFKRNSSDPKITFFYAMRLGSAQTVYKPIDVIKIKTKIRSVAEKHADIFDELTDAEQWEQVKPWIDDPPLEKAILTKKWEKLACFYIHIQTYLPKVLNHLALSYLCIQQDYFISLAIRENNWTLQKSL